MTDTDELVKRLHWSPEVIYLQVDPDGEGGSAEHSLAEGATWCEDQINDTDVKYVRADTIKSLQARITQLEAERDTADEERIAAGKRIAELEAQISARGEPVAQIVPCYVPSGKRPALFSEYQNLPIGTKLYLGGPAVPDGMVLVPKEATDKMVKAAIPLGRTASRREIYEAMLAAAPKGE